MLLGAEGGMMQYMMFGIYTTFRKFPIENAVRLKIGSFLKIIENRQYLGRLIRSWNIIFHKKYWKHNMSLKVLHETNTKKLEEFLVKNKP